MPAIGLVVWLSVGVLVCVCQGECSCNHGSVLLFFLADAYLSDARHLRSLLMVARVCT